MKQRTTKCEKHETDAIQSLEINKTSMFDSRQIIKTVEKSIYSVTFILNSRFRHTNAKNVTKSKRRIKSFQKLKKSRKSTFNYHEIKLRDKHDF